MRKNLSSFTGDDLRQLDIQIASAREVYQQRFDRYNYSIDAGHDGYAKRHHLKPMEEAKKHLDALLEIRESMENSMSNEQHIDLVDQSAYMATESEEKPFPWSTVGLLGVSLVVIIVLFKIL